MKPEQINKKKKGRNKSGSDITEIVKMNIHNFLFLKIICCLKNIYINKIAVGNPVVASKNIIELLLPLSVTSILESTPKKELIAFNVFEEI